jgi:hypothetical protein
VETRPVDDGPPPEETDSGSFLEAQRQHEWEKVRRQRLARLKDEGKVVDAEDAVAEWGRMISAVRAAILLVPDKVAPRVAPVADVRDCRAILVKECNALLTGLSEYRPNE